MTWYADLSPCDYFRPHDPARLRAVGWLARGHDYPVGPVRKRVLTRLTKLCVAPWSPVRFRGWHKCELCTGPTRSHFNVFIPGSQFLYVCPELITHCISVHRYAPPEEFCKAVLACPPMGSDEYHAAVAANGGGILGLDRTGMAPDKPT